MADTHQAKFTPQADNIVASTIADQNICTRPLALQNQYYFRIDEGTQMRVEFQFATAFGFLEDDFDLDRSVAAGFDK